MLFPPPSPPKDRRRVVVTGAGIVTGLGAGWEANAAGFRAGATAFRPVSRFNVSRHRAKQAAEVDLPGSMPATDLSPRHAGRLDRAGRLLLLAAVEAWRQSRWEPAGGLPVILGTTGGGMSLGERYYRNAVAGSETRGRQAALVVHYQAQRQGLALFDALGFDGPLIVIANACASSATAIGQAWEQIRSGQAERILTGGYDAIAQLIFAGFDSLQALSLTSCRPFDETRDGLALGEGAAVFAIETLESARARGAGILGEICGYGAITDVHHLTQPHPAGDAAVATMSAACEAAGVSPEQIGYINAHGTGTVLNDAAEAAGINRWAGPRAATLPVSSTKASVGHLLGAAGAVEAAACLMALQGQWLPPETMIGNPDPVCGFPVVTRPTDASIEYAMSNSFGFGGASASLVFRRWP